MNAKDALRQVIEFGHMLTTFYLDGLGDADLLVRSVPGANHIAWQLGHLVAGTRHMLLQLGRPAPDLPPGFEAAYTPDTASCDDPDKFHSKAEYQSLLAQMKAASLAAVDATPEDQLDASGPEDMREYAPNVAAVLMLLGSHLTMHAGQFVPIRRKLGQPPLF
jgi:hypothetical protein